MTRSVYDTSESRAYVRPYSTHPKPQTVRRGRAVVITLRRFLTFLTSLVWLFLLTGRLLLLLVLLSLAGLFMFLFVVAGLLFHPGGHAGCCTLHTGCTRSHEFDITHRTVALVVWDEGDGDWGFRALILLA